MIMIDRKSTITEAKKNRLFRVVCKLPSSSKRKTLDVFFSQMTTSCESQDVGGSLNGGTPKHPKMIILVGKTMVVGYHHFRKHPCSTLKILEVKLCRN